MFDWLFEGRPAVYLVLLLGGAVLLLLWWQQRSRRLLKLLGAVAGLALLYFLLGRLVTTDRERVATKIRDMADAFDKGDYDRLFANISNDFRYHSWDKKALREAVRSSVNRHGVKDARVKDVDVYEVDRDKKTAKVRFRGGAAWGDGNRLSVPCEADFKVDPDGQWRMSAIRFYKPFVDNTTEWDPFRE